jgi:hypothetical protein
LVIASLCAKELNIGLVKSGPPILTRIWLGTRSTVVSPRVFREGAMGRSVGSRFAAAATTLFIAFVVGLAAAAASEAPTPTVTAQIGASNVDPARLSFTSRIGPAVAGSTAVPPLRSLRFIGDLGDWTLQGVRKCTPGEVVSGRCRGPAIGDGSIVALRQGGDAGRPVVLHGRIVLYGASETAKATRIVALASFEHGAVGIGSFTIPITLLTRRSEISAAFPELEDGAFGIREFRFSPWKAIRTEGRSIPIASAHCPANGVFEVGVEAAFYPSEPVVRSVTTSAMTACTRR